MDSKHTREEISALCLQNPNLKWKKDKVSLKKKANLNCYGVGELLWSKAELTVNNSMDKMIRN